MTHFVYRQVLFTVGKIYDGNTDTLKLNYVNCQWQNYNNEVCEVEILLEPDIIAMALEGDTHAREQFFGTFAHYLMLSFNPAVIS